MQEKNSFPGIRGVRMAFFAVCAAVVIVVAIVHFARAADLPTRVPDWPGPRVVQGKDPLQGLYPAAPLAAQGYALGAAGCSFGSTLKVNGVKLHAGTPCGVQLGAGLRWPGGWLTEARVGLGGNLFANGGKVLRTVPIFTCGGCGTPRVQVGTAQEVLRLKGSRSITMMLYAFTQPLFTWEQVDLRLGVGVGYGSASRNGNMDTVFRVGTAAPAVVASKPAKLTCDGFTGELLARADVPLTPSMTLMVEAGPRFNPGCKGKGSLAGVPVKGGGVGVVGRVGVTYAF